MLAAALPQVLVSSCLLGQPVRYDGGHKQAHHPVLTQWLDRQQVVALCPEMAGGLPTPRLPAEIVAGNGIAVLQRQARVLDSAGADMTEPFVLGAQRALELVQRHGIRVAVLKESSPSCGSGQIYDGHFSGRSIAGMGVACALLREHGVAVFSELQWEAAAQALLALHATTP